MKTHSQQKGLCLQCGKALAGRKDKTFCSIECKNEYHNSLSRIERAEHKKTIAALCLNFKILKNCKRERRSSYSLAELEKVGFNPDLFTGLKRSRVGFDEYRCFSASYILSKGMVFNINIQPNEGQYDPSEVPSNHP